MLEGVLGNVVAQNAKRIFLYFCTKDSVFNSENVIWCGGEEIRKHADYLRCLSRFHQRRRPRLRKSIRSRMKNQTTKKKFYCLYIKTGSEWNYVKEIQPVLDSLETPCTGKLYCLGKRMRLKNGKEYIDALFQSYVFWETDSLDGFSFLQKGKGFVKILPQNNEPKSLSDEDVELLQSFLKYGTVMPILRVTFDINDKIQILDGLFNGQEALVKAVNRRNKRVNFDVELMNGSRLIGLTYEVVKKVEDSKEI